MFSKKCLLDCRFVKEVVFDLLVLLNISGLSDLTRTRMDPFPLFLQRLLIAESKERGVFGDTRRQTCVPWKQVWHPDTAWTISE